MRDTLTQTVQSAVGGMLPGPFAYAERWDESEDSYKGLIINQASSALIVVDNDSVIVDPEVAEKHRPKNDSEPKPGDDPGDPPVVDPLIKIPMTRKSKSSGLSEPS